MKINFDELDVVSLGQVRLTQKKFKEGALIATGVSAKNESIAIDVRFYFEKDGAWLPTKNGFWVGRKNWRVLEEALSESPETMNEIVCWGNKNRKFVVRSMSSYGGGIDFRYYCENSKYIGWEKKGIRFVLGDYFKARTLILDAIRDFENGVVGDRLNLVKGEIVPGCKQRQDKKNTVIHHHHHNNKNINPELIKILENDSGG